MKNILKDKKMLAIIVIIVVAIAGIYLYYNTISDDNNNNNGNGDDDDDDDYIGNLEVSTRTISYTQDGSDPITFVIDIANISFSLIDDVSVRSTLSSGSVDSIVVKHIGSYEGVFDYLVTIGVTGTGILHSDVTVYYNDPPHGLFHEDTDIDISIV